MTTTNKEKRYQDVMTFLSFAGSVLAGAATFVAVAYVQTGRRGKESPLIPQPLERQLSKLVTILDKRLGKERVDRGMDAIQGVLRGTGADSLVQLLLPVGQAIKDHQKANNGFFKSGRFAHLFGK